MNKTIKGTVAKKYGDNAIMLNFGGYGNNKMFSQYGGIDVPLEEGSIVELEYTEKEKDGKIYNNIVPGTTKVVGMKPKDISSNYSQQSSSPAVDRDAQFRTPTQLTRIDCLKAAVEYIVLVDKELRDISGVHVTKIAEDFEKWVNRDGK